MKSEIQPISDGNTSCDDKHQGNYKFYVPLENKITDNGDGICKIIRNKSGCTCHVSCHPQPSMWQIVGTKCHAISCQGRSKSTNWDDDGKCDTWRTFVVDKEKCIDLEVTVHRGENITKGSKIKDALGPRDPYIVLRIPQLKMNNPKCTKAKIDSTNPRWDETFNFYFCKNPNEPYIMEISLMDCNSILKDEALDKGLFPLDCLEEGIPKYCTFNFKGNSKVFTTFLIKKNKKSDLRFSMTLCEEEKAYLRKRRKKVFESMKALLGDNGPHNKSEVPTIGILGSGGGFRAMIGLTGALRALQDSGILDCTTYLAGLSGSTWCISTLYCDTLKVKEFQKTLRESVGRHWLWNIFNIHLYMADMLSKYWKGQCMCPVDIFGHFLGDMLLGKEKKNHMKLSDLQARISEADVPFPLFAGLHATERSSVEFSEWVEFSPYEIGLAKYGTFMETEDFGSKFFAGKRVKKLNEFPLHYLQAVWGSAFTINLKNLITNFICTATEDIDDITSKKPCPKDEEDSVSDTNFDGSKRGVEDFAGRTSNLPMKWPSDDSEKRCSSSGWTSLVIWNFLAFFIFLLTWTSSQTTWMTWIWTSLIIWILWLIFTSSLCEGKMNKWIVSACVRIDKSYLLNLRALKPGRVYNPFRDLPFRYVFVQDQSNRERNKKDYKEDTSDKYSHGCKFQPLHKESERISVMDSGFTFCSPYPLLLRRQRSVDIFLSFDFSLRYEDLHVNRSTFKQLVKAEKWAKERHIPFPPVKEKIDKYLGKKIQECYVFDSTNDAHVPVILHFPLVNNKFRQYKSPGVIRTSEEEFDFAHFSCFGKNSEFGTLKCHYDSKEFDRLAKLMEFNTLLHKDTIIQQINNFIINKRQDKHGIRKIFRWCK